MATYIALSTFTDQGMRSVKDTTKRAAAVKELARKFGVNMSSIYWTLGHYDLVVIIEADDEQAALTFAMAVGAAGNVRTHTLRAFNADEMGAVLDRMP
ncbi:GYD domain-containing protein [Lysobacter niabensis]|uniref:GYD domain-containing protein n=1 Tax=Agrilutibacter niabensis TaxID=380628 RepID=UPI00360DC9B1